MHRPRLSLFQWLLVLVIALPMAAAGGTVPSAQKVKVEQLHMSTVRSGGIHLDVNQIPKVTEEMPVLKLSSVEPPRPYIEKLLRKTAPTASQFGLLRKSEMPPASEKRSAHLLKRIQVSTEKGAVVSYLDAVNGNFEIAPRLQDLKPMRAAPEAALRVARAMFERKDFIPQDDTRVALDKPANLLGETFVRPGAKSPLKASAKQRYLVSVVARRYVGKYPVYGPGSRAAVAVGANEVVDGVLHWWKAAHVIARVKAEGNGERVAREIKTQLEPAARGAEVTVDNVSVGYYDGNGDYMQPVYRFTATIHEMPDRAAKSQNLRTLPDDHVIGYVPIGKALEPIPSLSAQPVFSPEMPRGKGVPPLRPAPVRPGDPTIGRYVVRNDNPNWVANANEFWSGLTWFWPLASNFSNAQYYWAYPWEYTTSRNTFVNSVNFTLTEGHGDWWLFSTLRNCCDLVDINTIPGGYGSSVGGRLRYWAIHSCEVVPAPEDTANWPNPWWNIFRGLHSVVGYRTIMYIDDDVGYPFGFKLSLGVPIVSAWLSTVHSSSAYSGNPTYPAHGGIVRPMGRASAIAVCGHESDTIYNATNIGAATCLRVFWYPD